MWCARRGGRLVDDIEFSPEDAGRSDPDFLVELCQAVIEAVSGMS